MGLPPQTGQSAGLTGTQVAVAVSPSCPALQPPAHPLSRQLWPLAEPCYTQQSNPNVRGGNGGQRLDEGRIAGLPNQPSTQAQPHQLKEDSGRGAAALLTRPTPSRLRLPGPAGVKFRPSGPLSPSGSGGCVCRVEMPSPGGSSEEPAGCQRSPHESRESPLVLVRGRAS